MRSSMIVSVGLALALCGCAQVLRGVADQMDPLGAEIRKREELERETERRQYEAMRREDERRRQAGEEVVEPVEDVRNYDFPELRGQLQEGVRRERAYELEDEKIITQAYADCVRRERERNPEGLASLRRMGNQYPERMMCPEEWFHENEAREEQARVKKARGSDDYHRLTAMKAKMLRQRRWNPSFVDDLVRMCLATDPSVQEVVFEDQEFWIRWRHAREDGSISYDDYTLAEMFLRRDTHPETLGRYLLDNMRNATYNITVKEADQARYNVIRLERHLKAAGKLFEVKQALNSWLRNSHERELRYSNYDSWRELAFATRPTGQPVRPARASGREPSAPAPPSAPGQTETGSRPSPRELYERGY